ELRSMREEAAAAKPSTRDRATADYSPEEIQDLRASEPLAAPAPEPEPEPATEPSSADMERVKNLKVIADYQVGQVLGSGGMGAVFLGQRLTGEYVAIKVMLNQAASEAEKGRFKREITLTRRIKHKNVIGIIDVGTTTDGMTYLVVPTLVGKELRH